MRDGIDRRIFLRTATKGGGLALAFVALQAPALLAEGPVHVVHRGDTLTGIGRRHGISVRDLQLWNGLTSDLILVGQKLLLKPMYNHLPLREITKPKLNILKWRHIIAHHSATPNGNAKIFDTFHRRKGMENGLAYHFVIGNGTNSGDGEVEVGGRWLKQLNGGHVRSEAHNANSIGVCVVGNFEQRKPTRKQATALIELTDYLMNRMLRGRPKFMVHRDLEQTLCPGRHFPTKRLHTLFG
jgi:LysM repeat protein